MADGLKTKTKKMCKHNWTYLIPSSSAVSTVDSVSYGVDVMLSRVGNILFCAKCCRTGHPIKSNRGGLRLHSPESTQYFIGKANEIRKNYNLELLTLIE